MRFEKNERNIRNDIEVCITRCMNNAFNACSPRNPQEPDFVAELVQGIPQDLYKSLNTYVPEYQFAVSGVFCHQKPLAVFGAPKNPELGDILLVYIEENQFSVKKCNALLMQAKKFRTIPHIVPSAEEHQLKLYEEWPTFTLKRAGILNGLQINVQPKTLNSGAQYLLMQAPYKDEKKVCCAYPDKILVPEKKLSDQIIDLMKFFTGRTFYFDATDDGWSDMIRALIRISGISSFSRRTSGRINVGRRVSYGNPSLMGLLNELVGSSDDDGEDAVSCLLIYAKESKEVYRQVDLLDFVNE